MCGFAGLLSSAPRTGEELQAFAAVMADAIRHRGPDDGGTWADEAAQAALGFRRLAIIDISSAGHQPMQSACGRFVIAFNGEIYNYAHLRRELESENKAPAWRGHSDTEVLLACIAAWGLRRTLQRASGMFGLALWDRANRTLHLARDRMGEKPVYYGWLGGDFAFASELKAFRVLPGFTGDLDLDALALYMQLRTVPAPFSIYRGCRKLQPGTTLSIQWAPGEKCSPEIEQYWSFSEAARAAMEQSGAVNEGDALARLESRLAAAVAAQSLADVPLGAFLSGGVDSSLIVALMQAQSSRPVKTFTIGFDDVAYDESPAARAVAKHLGTEHHELRLRPADARAIIPALPRLYDEPFADSSQIPTYLVCKGARAHVTVALSGDGGDELFGGYSRYSWGPRLWAHLSPIPFRLRRIIGSAITATSPAAWDRAGRAAGSNWGFSQLGDKAHKVGRALQSVRSIDDLYRSVITEWAPEESPVKTAHRTMATTDDEGLVSGIDSPEQRMMLWDTLTYLPDDILTKVDRAAMGASLETRVPFLDPLVVECAWQLPVSMKVRDGQGKWALRQILYKHVPRGLIERPKAGFALPLGEWLRGPLREWAEDLLDEQRLASQGFIDPVPISQAWAQHLTRRYDWSSRLWTILMLQAWLKEYGRCGPTG